MENPKKLYNKKMKHLSFYLGQSRNPAMLLRWSKHWLLNVVSNETFLRNDLCNKFDFLFLDFLIKIMQILEKYTETFPNDVPCFFETFRSNKRQFELFSACKSKVKSYGMHYYCLAVDLVNFKNGLVRWNLNYDKIFELANLNGVYSLRPYEDCHLQFIPVSSQNDFRNYARNMTMCIQDLLNVKIDGIIGFHTHSQVIINNDRIEAYLNETENIISRGFNND